MNRPQRVGALIVAGGRGTRAAQPGAPPKQYVDLGGRSVLARTVSRFLDHPRVGLVLVAIGAEDLERYDVALGPLAARCALPVIGGDTRQSSVLAGLEAMSIDPPDVVLIHDAVRPFVPAAALDRVIDALADADGAVAGLAEVDTLKEVDDEARVVATLPRDRIWRAQTPQGFRFDIILAAHRSAAGAGYVAFTDDAAVAEWAGLEVVMVEGGQRNVKLTTSDDIRLAGQLTSDKGGYMEYRSGSGFDVHRLVDGDHVWLCGVRIAHDRGLEGHSDADVALHALTDALLGAIGAGDIGQHFPPSDPAWRGAPSRIFLAAAADKVRALGGQIINVDVTILCEAPKISPHREGMRKEVGAILGLQLERVSVKATTTERLGFTGRGEGIAAMAAASVALPS